MLTKSGKDVLRRSSTVTIDLTKHWQVERNLSYDIFSYIFGIFTYYQNFFFFRVAHMKIKKNANQLSSSTFHCRKVIYNAFLVQEKCSFGLHVLLQGGPPNAEYRKIKNEWHEGGYTLIFFVLTNRLTYTTFYFLIRYCYTLVLLSNWLHDLALCYKLVVKILFSYLELFFWKKPCRPHNSKLHNDTYLERGKK